MYSEREQARRGGGLAEVGRALLFAFGYFALIRVGRLFVHPVSDVAMIWPAAGYAVGWILIADRRQRLLTTVLLLVTVVMGNLTAGVDVVGSVAFAVINTAQTVVAVVAWLALGGGRVDLDSLRRPVLVLAAALAGGGAGALLGAAWIVSQVPAAFTEVAAGWLISDAGGILIFAPVVVAFHLVSAARSARFVGWGPMMAIGGGLVLSAAFALSVETPTLVLAAIPVLIFSASRIGTRLTAIVVASFAAGSLIAVSLGQGPSILTEDPTQIRWLVMFWGVLWLVSMKTASDARALDLEVHRFTSVVESSRLGIVLADMSGSVVRANDRAIQMLGHAAVVDHPLAERRWLGQDEPARVWNHVNQAGRTLEISEGEPFSDPAMGDVRVLFVDDISARLEQTETIDRLHQIIEASPDFIGFASPEGEIQFLSRGARRMIGEPQETPVGEVQVGSYSPAWARELMLTVAIPYAKEHGEWTGELAYLGPDGEEIPVSQVVLAHFDAEGRVRFFSTIARDLSPIRQAQQDRFDTIAGVVHDLKNPLTAITGAMQLLEDLDPDEELDAKDHLKAIMEGGLAGVRSLVDGLSESISLSIETPGDQSVDLGQVITAVVRNESVAASKAGVSLVARAESGNVAMSERDVSRVVTNLTSNAIKYNVPGGSVSVDATRDGDEFVLTIADTGLGIEPSELSHIFGRGHRTRTAAVSDRPGTGLGLWNCRSLVESGGGTLTVVSEVGVGSTFTARLPVPVLSTTTTAAPG